MPTTRSTANIHTDQHLTSMAVRYANAATSYIGHLLSPLTSVVRDADKFRVFGRDSFKSLPPRADGDKAESVDESYGTPGTYSCVEYAGRSLLTDKALRNSDNAWNLKVAKTNMLTERALLTQELQIMTEMTTTGNYASASYYSTVAGGSKWDDYDNADPFQQISEKMETVVAGCGRIPNIIGMDVKILARLSRHPLAADHFKYTGNQLLRDWLLGIPLFGMKVAAASCLYDTANARETAARSAVWGENVILAYVDPADQGPEGGVTFARTFYTAADYMKAGTYTEPGIEGTWYQVGVNIDPKIVCNDAAYLFQDVLT